ncbi:pyridoxamine 5'-phosphate oxidase [Aquisalimonas asiatica]|uniref:Pyridoxine/pyridoxamine 5'-phosphate oxidase n=1 Tax=Aquisalimonas asiatica TaxID=406100 RepID=A0A1H8PMK7_9GAMM|nr:pyridoxamine 5'-phosphate oxidase [Aquisalimonas asiatica]SEO43249.1 Pyridoxamine 5'-phosphate oxidase [Aquisalimonas asiatica]
MTLREQAIDRFQEWFRQAQDCAEIADATAMTLATVSDGGQPAARTVLLKGVDHRGFVFYTNTRSRKGLHLATQPRAAVCFYWAPLNLQVLVEGDVSQVSGDEADAYFASRPRLSQVGAWASEQSQPLDSPETLAARVDALEREYADQPVPRPPHWTGYRIDPTLMEFWAAADGRLHRRERYQRDGDGAWSHCFVNP